MSEPIATKTRSAGDVLDYIPDKDWGWHCREGIAIVNDRGLAVDTYWNLSGNGDHVLTETEMESAGLRFKLGDFRKLGDHWDHRREEWLTYAPSDRQIITAQRGLQSTYYVRKGAAPDLATRIQNARDRIAAAEEEVRSAQSRLRWRQDQLAELLEP